MNMEMKILVLDDMPSFRRLWTIAARRHNRNIDIVAVATIGEALEQIKEGGFTHLILDGSVESNSKCDTLPVLKAALDADIFVVAASSMFNEELLAAGAQAACIKDEVMPRLLAGTLFPNEVAA